MNAAIVVALVLAGALGQLTVTDYQNQRYRRATWDALLCAINALSAFFVWKNMG